jgi:hypothetical protein
VDDGYWHDIRDTIGILDRILNDPKMNGCDFYYRSSW